MDRRTLLMAPLGLVATQGVAAVGAGADRLDSKLAAPGFISPEATIKLWPGTPPIAPTAAFTEVIETLSQNPQFIRRRVGKVTVPRIHKFTPKTPNGTAVLIIPGGGFNYGYFDGEGFNVARKLNEYGITAFVLFYRLANDGWADAPNVGIVDAQRALRLIRARASELGVRPDRTGVIGFSAGGYVSGSLATRFYETLYARQDDIDDMSARPDFAGVMYAPQSVQPEIASRSLKSFFGDQPTPDDIAKYSLDKRITAQSPPLFLTHAENDATVSVENTLRLRDAARAAGVRVETLLFADGGHGYGVKPGNTGASQHWPQLFSSFITQTLKPAARP